MTTPYLGEIKLVSWSFAPRGWAFCNGQLLPINQNQALFSILGTTYGGDGRTTFGLPDFRGRAPVHQGSSLAVGNSGGEVSHTLTTAEMASHGHGVNAAPSPADQPSPAGHLWAERSGGYSSNAATTAMNATGCAPAGGGQPHANMPPYLVMNFVIALQGIFPSRT